MQELKQEKSLIKQNILLYLGEKNVTPYEFYKISGVTRGVLAQNNGISEDNISRFLAYAKDVNPAWLITGKGEMLLNDGMDKPDTPYLVNIKPDEVYDRIFLHSIPLTGLTLEQFADFCKIDSNRFLSIYKKEEPLSEDILGIISIKMGLNPIWINKGIENQFERGEFDRNAFLEKYNEYCHATHAVPATHPGEGIPLIPTSAMAGFFSGEQQVLEYECERFVVPTFKGAEFLISVKGSSMYPKYNSGDIVACKRLPLKDLFFQWNKVYVLDTDQGPLIKRVQQGSDDEHIMIVSDNEKYAPFELSLKHIYNVALVIGVIRLE